MNDYVLTTRIGSIAVLRLDHPPVNALSVTVRRCLLQALQQLRDDPAVRGVVIAGSGKCFSAGADISEFERVDARAATQEHDPAQITELIDSFDKPVLAALHGFALGGGLELALGCHYRVARPDTAVGLPEIQLGLLPGAGGTQRLPRLIDPGIALDMLLTGRSLEADEAHKVGLIDAVITDEFPQGAVQYLEALVRNAAPPRRTRDLAAPAIDIPKLLSDRALGAAPARRPLSFAGQQIVDCVAACSTLPFEAGMKLERAKFLACNATAEARALQHGFFAKRRAAKVPDIPPGTVERPIKEVAIVGGGTMGRGIAMTFSDAGYRVTVIETDEARALAANQAIRSDYQRLGASGRVTPAVAQERASRITATSRDEALASSDLLIEAVFEDLDVKRAVSARLGRLCKPGAIIASNTSTLDINTLANASGRPSDFLGMHFFSPAQVMRLVEVIRGEQTAPQVLLTGVTLARQLNKHPVISGVCYGFIGNRMLEPYLRETEAMLLEGALPRQIDRALESFGMAMGPCRMLDLAGVDVAAKVVIERDKQDALPPDPLYRIVCRTLFDLGRFGQKTGAGFYKYDGRKAVDDPQALAIIRELAERRQVVARASIADDEIVERCLLPLINEGCKIVEEGIAYRSSDLDVVWMSGYGFPPERGGPMFYAEQLGWQKVRDRLAHYGRVRGDPYGYWTPAGSLLATCSSSGESS